MDSLENGCNTVYVRTVDSNVVVILIGKLDELLRINPDGQIWVGFGTGKNYICHHINAIAEALGPERSKALPFFHSYTGCDTVSASCWRGKNKAWSFWLSFPEITETFNYFIDHPFKEVKETEPHFK